MLMTTGFCPMRSKHFPRDYALRMTRSWAVMLDGISRRPVLLEGKSITSRQLFWGGRGVRDGKWKISFNELYDLDADIGETTDLSKTYPERFDAMKKTFSAWAEDVGAERRF
jgi:hypothetical protein